MATKITDFASAAKLGATFGPATSGSAEFAGNSIDLLDADGPAFAILSVGSDAGAATVSFTIQASSDGNTWANIEGLDPITITGAGIGTITFERPARFLRGSFAIEDYEDPITMTAIIGQGKKLF